MERTETSTTGSVATHRDRNRNLVVPLVARALVLVLLLSAWAVFIHGSDAEASAIFAAGGDAGLWVVGTVFVTCPFLPSAAASGLSLVKPGSVPAARSLVLCASLITGVAAWAVVALYPAARSTGERLPLRHEHWQHVNHLYLLFAALLAASALTALGSGVLELSRYRTAKRQPTNYPLNLLLPAVPRQAATPFSG